MFSESSRSCNLLKLTNTPLPWALLEQVCRKCVNTSLPRRRLGVALRRRGFVIHVERRRVLRSLFSHGCADFLWTELSFSLEVAPLGDEPDCEYDCRVFNRQPSLFGGFHSLGFCSLQQEGFRPWRCRFQRLLQHWSHLPRWRWPPKLKSWPLLEKKFTTSVWASPISARRGISVRLQTKPCRPAIPITRSPAAFQN